MVVLCYGIILASIVTGFHATNNTQCPPLPTNCQCNHKANQVGFRISCKNLNNMSLQSIPSDMSVDLDLAGNNLVSLNSSSFPNPNKIKKLILKNNFIKDIADDTFKGFMSLKKLDLSGNNLVQITDRTFAGLDKTLLQLVDLRENQIISISQRAFNGLKITKLILSAQLNANKENAQLIAYPDFLSFSLIQELDLDDNRLLCDCALQWLALWLKRGSTKNKHALSGGSTCYLPKEVQQQKFSDVAKDPDWKCDQYVSTFTLPLFQLYPSSSQMLFENDSFAVSCQATWVQRGYIVWWKNGLAVDYSQDDRIHVRHLTDLKSALYTSTLLISGLKLSDTGNITCELQVFRSGTISALTNLYVIGSQSSHCSADSTLTEQGSVTWPTVLNGATVQRACPNGGFQRSPFLSRACQENSTWGKPKVGDCFFKNSLTKKLQEFSYMAQPRNKNNIYNLARKFSNFSQNNFALLRSKYDFYYAYNSMYEIMMTFATIRGRQYYRFFWGAIGLIAEKHSYTSALYEAVYGSTAMRRFRHLSEAFVIQEAKKEMPFSINYHGNMAAISRVQSFKSANPQVTKTWQCFIILPSNGRINLQVLCPPLYETKLSTVSSIYIQTLTSQASDEIQITSLVFAKSTFFRGFQKNSLDIVSPVVGFQIKDLQSSDKTKNSSQEVATWISFKSEFEHVDPRLVVWRNESDGAGSWGEVDGCKIIKPFKRITQFNCNMQAKLFENFLYFALAMKHIPLGTMNPQYMEAVLYVGAALACLLLTFTLLVYVLIRQLRFNRNETVIMMNLYVALIATQLIFAIGMHRVDNDLLCKAVAMSLHYFLLCALLWLGCGGVILIRLLRKKYRCVVNEHDPVIKYYLISWGLPLIICSITIAYDRDNYVTNEYCWLKRATSHGAFIAPGCIILAVDLILFCYLHSLINLVYPEPLEDSTSEGEQLVSRDQCNPKSCKYKMRQHGCVQERCLDRGELLLYLRSCLLLLLLMPSTVICVIMMYSYKNSTSYYLYQFFSYAAAFTNILLGGTVFFFHFIKRKNVWKLVRDYIIHIRHSPAEIKDETNSEQMTSVISKLQTTNGHAYEPSDIVSEQFDATHGVYGLSDQVQSEGSNIISIIDRAGAVDMENFNEAQDIVFDDKLISQKLGVYSDAQTDTDKGVVQSKGGVKSQSEMSEPDKVSNGGQNSIGECSLTSSRRVRPKNPDIPENLKAFVPENWRPVKRRGKSKGSSYYPYYLNDSKPLTASVAYSSKASSVSTTVGGVPLYIDKKRAADNLAMYNDLFQPGRVRNQLAPIRQPLLSNVPIPLAQGTGYPLKLLPSPGFVQQHANIPLTMLNPVHEQNISQNASIPTNHNPTMNNNVFLPPVSADQGVAKVDNTLNSPISTNQEVVKINNNDTLESDGSENEEVPVKVAPVIYIPMPHVTIKQFQLRSETSV